MSMKSLPLTVGDQPNPETKSGWSENKPQAGLQPDSERDTRLRARSILRASLNLLALVLRVLWRLLCVHQGVLLEIGG